MIGPVAHSVPRNAACTVARAPIPSRTVVDSRKVIDSSAKASVPAPSVIAQRPLMVMASVATARRMGASSRMVAVLPIEVTTYGTDGSTSAPRAARPDSPAHRTQLAKAMPPLASALKVARGTT